MKKYLLLLLLVATCSANQMHVFNLSMADTGDPKPAKAVIRFQHFWYVDDVLTLGGHVDATVGPGQTTQVNLTMYDVEYGSFIRMEKFNPDGELVGNSFVDSGAGTFTSTAEVWAHVVGGPPDYTPPDIVTHAVDVGPAAGWEIKPLPTPDSKKTLWLVADATLTADVFREGIDKIVAKDDAAPAAGETTGMPSAGDIGSTVPGDRAAALTAIANDLSGELGSQAGDLSDALNTAIGTITTGGMTAASDIEVFEVGPSIALPDLAGSPSLSTNFFGMFGSYNIIEKLGWIREIILAFMALTFVAASRDVFLKFYAQWWLTPTTPTKTDAASLIPAGGTAWNAGKTVATAVIMIGILIAALTVTITAFNTNIGTIMEGMTFANAFSTAAATINAITGGDSSVAKVYNLMAMVFPFGAAFQFYATLYALKWLMPALWSVAQVAARFFNV